MTTLDEWLSAAGNNDPDWPRHPDFVAADLDRAVAALRAVLTLPERPARVGQHIYAEAYDRGWDHALGVVEIAIERALFPLPQSVFPAEAGAATVLPEGME